MIVHTSCVKVGHRQAPQNTKPSPLNSAEGFVPFKPRSRRSSTACRIPYGPPEFDKNSNFSKTPGMTVH